MNFVATCKRGLGKLQRKADDRSKRRTEVIRLKEGGTLEICGLSKMAKEAMPFREKITREEAKAVRTNIKQTPALPVKTLARDLYFEELLHSGTYLYPNMFLVVNPFGEAPLTALILFETEGSCGIRVTVPGKIQETDRLRLSSAIYQISSDSGRRIVPEPEKQGENRAFEREK